MSPTHGDPSTANCAGGKIHPFFKASRPGSDRASSPALHDLSDSSQSGSRKKRKTAGSKDLGSRKRTNTLEGPLLSLLKPQSATPLDRATNGLETPPVFEDEGLEDAEGEVDDEMPGFFPGAPQLPQTTTRTPSYSPPATSQAPPKAPLICSTSTTSVVPDKPSKVLKFNVKTGTLGSPPKAKSKKPEPLEGAKPGRGRPRKPPAQRIVTMRYGTDKATRHRIGAAIQQILARPPRPQQPLPLSDPIASPLPTVPEAAISKVATSIVVPGNSIPAQSSKSTHPFFKKGAAATSIPPPPPPAKKTTISLSTPCSPRRKIQPPVPSSELDGPGFGFKTKGVKVPGAQFPLFPPMDMVHVRGLDSYTPASHSRSSESLSKLSPPQRKSKQQAITISTSESIITCLQSELGISNIMAALARLNDDFTPVPPSLRIPTRHVESGRRVQARIKRQMRTSPPVPAAAAETQSASTCDAESSSEDEIAIVSRSRLQQRRKKQQARPIHPFIFRLYHQLADGLSAYDRCTCESTSWTQKYAPQSAAQVLQSGREALLLKEWLVALKVNAVHTSNPDAKSKSKSSKKRGKKKKGKLDGFIVDEHSDDDSGVYSPDEESDAEVLAEWGPDAAGDKRSVVRTVTGRLKNAVVLSGKHGVGKTATVYAVAKELGFEVFEINAASRRAGKDITERVGDMTRNHLVRHQGGEPGEPSSAGKSPAMASFFAKKSLSTVTQASAQTPATTADNKEATAQKQSLILIEEADILYDEDKNFWATLVTLMTQAKRPFIITCNDETLIPLHTLPLHAIFRLRAPPREPSVDALLLIAACEGHVLHRQAVEELWASRKGDLRAVLAELQFWCQFGVGDVKGGFDWLLARWPKGSDIDERGDTLRVVSEGVYEGGMGLLSRDSTAAQPEDPEVAVECWESFGVDLYGWETGGQNVAARHSDDRNGRLRALEAFADLADSMSASDILSISAYGEMNQIRLDTEAPGMAPKRRDDFIVGYTLLEADPVSSYSTLPLSIPAQIKASAQKHQLSPLAADPASSDPTHKLKLLLSAPAAPPPTTRRDYSAAFDPIAASSIYVWAAHIDPSVFDRPMRLIALDVAPYVRSIIYSDTHRRAPTPTADPPSTHPTKKLRATRAALSAMDGAHRASARARTHDYFAACTGVDAAAILATAGPAWPALAHAAHQSAVAAHAAWFAAEVQKMQRRAAEEQRRAAEEQRRALELRQVIQAQARELALQQQQQAGGMVMQIQPFIPPSAAHLPPGHDGFQTSTSVHQGQYHASGAPVSMPMYQDPSQYGGYAPQAYLVHDAPQSYAQLQSALPLYTSTTSGGPSTLGALGNGGLAIDPSLLSGANEDTDMIE
ncbi:hypothetical protein BROUX41_003393 [Berkeleyomyces rouxiae]|uniref:uncharacterized protein n=1 Tax=Berkeleyomyces rouxiae TaxID=2035830 RepID=UPI003B7FD73B